MLLAAVTGAVSSRRVVAKSNRTSPDGHPSRADPGGAEEASPGEATSWFDRRLRLLLRGPKNRAGRSCWCCSSGACLMRRQPPIVKGVRTRR